MVKNANLVWRACWWSGLIIATSFSFVVTGCDRTPTSASAASKPLAEFFEIRVGDKKVRMQLAVREQEMERGLMERRNLGADEGMLFVYDHSQPMSFWMRDTPTALDIGFFDGDGVLQEIYPLHPYDETGVKSRGTRLMLALEMNQGWYHNNGVRPGAQLDLKAVKAALEARGFAAEKFRFGQ